MFKKGNLFAVLALTLSASALYAQQTTVVTPVPGITLERAGEQIRTINLDSGGSYLGVQLQEVSKDNFSKFGLSAVRGVAIEKVSDNSPAKQAGLQDGDVIIRFDGEEVSSVRKLQRLIGEIAPDHQAKVTVLRSGSERELTATLAKRPTPTFQNGSFSIAPGDSRTFQYSIPDAPEVLRTLPRITTPPSGGNFEFFTPGARLDDNLVWNLSSGRRIGVNTMSLNKQLGDYFGVADGKGILISNVRENSPAAKAGIKAGDVIIEADGKAVSEPVELTKMLSNKDKKTITLTILRNKNRQTVTVEPEEAPTMERTLQAVPAVKGTLIPLNGMKTTIAPRVLTLSTTSIDM